MLALYLIVRGAGLNCVCQVIVVAFSRVFCQLHQCNMGATWCVVFYYPSDVQQAHMLQLCVFAKWMAITLGVLVAALMLVRNMELS